MKTASKIYTIIIFIFLCRRDFFFINYFKIIAYLIDFFLYVCNIYIIIYNFKMR